MRSGRILPTTLGIAASAVVLLTGCYQQDPAITQVETVEFPDPVAVEPGSLLSFGDAVWVEQSSGGETTLLGVAVLDIVQGEPWYWSNYANPQDLAGLTPFFVLVQRQWGAADARYDISLYPVLEDGSPGYLMETDAVGAVNPATCEEIGVPQPADPLQRIDCLVTAAPAGVRVTAVYYDGTFADPASPLDPTPYLEAPIVWSAG